MEVLEASYDDFKEIIEEVTEIIEKISIWIAETIKKMAESIGLILRRVKYLLKQKNMNKIFFLSEHSKKKRVRKKNKKRIAEITRDIF